MRLTRLVARVCVEFVFAQVNNSHFISITIFYITLYITNQVKVEKSKLLV